MPIKNLDVLMLDMNDTAMEREKDVPLVVKDVAIIALTSQYNDEPNLNGDEKFRRFELAMKVNKGGAQDYAPEEIVLMKKLIGKAYSPLVVGRAFEVLNA